MWFTLAKVWLSLWLTMISLIDANLNEPGRAFPTSPIKPGSEQTEDRLRERWTAFVAEANKELTFDYNASSPKQVSAVKDRDLFLTCAFTKPLRRHQVSFLRQNDLSLLLVGNYRHTRDQRFSAAQASDGFSWTLRLKSVAFEDRGRYECQVCKYIYLLRFCYKGFQNCCLFHQVNTSPESISLVFNVTVLPGRTRILPPDTVIYVNAGGQLNLQCVIETGPVRPQFILWYKEDKLVEYSSSRATVNLAWNKTNSVSELVIENVTLGDNGFYKCDSDLTEEASIQVILLKLGSDTNIYNEAINL